MELTINIPDDIKTFYSEEQIVKLIEKFIQNNFSTTNKKNALDDLYLLKGILPEDTKTNETDLHLQP